MASSNSHSQASRSNYTLDRAAQAPLLKKSSFNLFRELAYQHIGISIKDNRLERVQTRLRKRLLALNLKTFEEYYQVLNERADAVELQEFFNALTITKTEFFRETRQLEHLSKNLMQPLLDLGQKQGEKKLRVWSSACATGEEPYTIAMMLQEAIAPAERYQWDVKVLASDINTIALEQATRGSYPAESVQKIPPHLRRIYLTKDPKIEGEEETYTVNEVIKQWIAFRHINLNAPRYPIRTQFDMILCRNVFIYFNEDTQQKLINRFYDLLNEGGYLLLGHSEFIQKTTFVRESFNIYRKPSK